VKRVKQVEESKNLITDALISLLQTYELREITISQITAEAGVGRNTFYRNFENKEDIIHWMFEQIYAEAEEVLQQKKNPRPKDLLLFRFRLIKENPQLTIIAKRREVFDIMHKFRLKKSTSLFQNFLMPKGYKLDFNIGGLFYVTSRWIEEGMKESPEEMVKILSKLFRI